MRAVTALALGSNIAFAQSAPVVTGDARGDELLNQMTLAKKLTLIHGGAQYPKSYQGQAGYIGAVNFAGRVVSAAKGPEIWVSDAAKKKLGKPYQSLNWKSHEGFSLKGFEPEKFALWSLPPGS